MAHVMAAGRRKAPVSADNSVGTFIPVANGSFFAGPAVVTSVPEVEAGDHIYMILAAFGVEQGFSVDGVPVTAGSSPWQKLGGWSDFSHHLQVFRKIATADANTPYSVQATSSTAGDSFCVQLRTVRGLGLGVEFSTPELTTPGGAYTRPAVTPATVTSGAVISFASGRAGANFQWTVPGPDTLNAGDGWKLHQPVEDDGVFGVSQVGVFLPAFTGTIPAHTFNNVGGERKQYITMAIPL